MALRNGALGTLSTAASMVLEESRGEVKRAPRLDLPPLGASLPSADCRVWAQKYSGIRGGGAEAKAGGEGGGEGEVGGRDGD